MNKGLLIILSGPSGSGKDTVLDELVKRTDIQRSVSMTTRNKRENEIDGRDYIFVKKDYFLECVEKNNILEFAEYSGNYYGTPKTFVDRWLADGKTVVLKIEVQGADKIRKIYPDAVSIFIVPPSLSVLESRLRERETDSEADILMRLEAAKYEISRAENYDYLVINDVLENAVNDMMSIIGAEKIKTPRMINNLREVMLNA